MCVMHYLFFQSRYVGYVEQIFTKLNRRMPGPVPLKLRSIKIDGISGW